MNFGELNVTWRRDSQENRIKDRQFYHFSFVDLTVRTVLTKLYRIITDKFRKTLSSYIQLRGVPKENIVKEKDISWYISEVIFKCKHIKFVGIPNFKMEN